jgi:hypothetical protein
LHELEQIDREQEWVQEQQEQHRRFDERTHCTPRLLDLEVVPHRDRGRARALQDLGRSDQ